MRQGRILPDSPARLCLDFGLLAYTTMRELVFKAPNLKEFLTAAPKKLTQEQALVWTASSHGCENTEEKGVSLTSQSRVAYF